MMAPRRQVNPDAYELYLHGRYEWSKVSPEGLQKAVEYYQKALALDPSDARYSSGLADAYLLQTVVVGTLPQKEGMAKVKEYARRALALDDSSAEAHASMAIAALFGDWNWKEAEHHAQDAIQINAGYSTAHLVYSVILATEGRVNEAIEQDRLAMDLDPLSLVINWNASAALFYARRYDEAIAQANRAVQLDPLSSLPHGALARGYEQTGQFEKELDVMEKLMPMGMHGGAGIVAKLREAYAKGGAAGYWRATLEMQLAAKPQDDIRIAMVYVKLGDRDKAFTFLERAFAEHSGDMIFLDVEPGFDPIRDDPRFKALIRRIGFPPRA